MYLLDWPDLKMDYGLLLIKNQETDATKNYKKEELFINLDDCYFLANIVETEKLNINGETLYFYIYERPFLCTSNKKFPLENFWLNNYDYSLFIRGIEISLIIEKEKVTGIKNNKWTTFYKYHTTKKEEEFFSLPTNAVKLKHPPIYGKCDVYEIKQNLITNL